MKFRKWIFVGQIWADMRVGKALILCYSVEKIFRSSPVSRSYGNQVIDCKIKERIRLKYSMCIATTKKAAGQLQKILNKLGEFGGVIETDNPSTWWNLDVEIESILNDEKNIMIGVYKELNGDIMFDPLFHVTAKLDEDKISEVCVNQCTEETALGRTIVDCDNILHGFGQVTKDPYGLKKRFCNFMDNMMMGPYLSTGRILRLYDGVLDE